MRLARREKWTLGNGLALIAILGIGVGLVATLDDPLAAEDVASLVVLQSLAFAGFGVARDRGWGFALFWVTVVVWGIGLAVA